MVITGTSTSMLKGVGTINGSGAYQFVIWARDGDLDTFRIKIWLEDENGLETVEYDSGSDQIVDRGFIVVYKPRRRHPGHGWNGWRTPM